MTCTAVTSAASAVRSRAMVLLAVVLSLLVGASGCARMASSASVSSSVSLASSSVSSDVLSSPFHSSSRSSAKPQEQDEQLQDDIEVYTASWFAVRQREQVSLPTGLAQIAAHHGISDWQARPLVWIAMGRGLALAGCTADVVAQVADAWGEQGVAHSDLLGRGYRAVANGQGESLQHGSLCLSAQRLTGDGESARPVPSASLVQW